MSRRSTIRRASATTGALALLAGAMLAATASPAAAGFAPAVTYRAADAAEGVAVGDVDRDGIPDVVTANGFMSSVSLLRGVGDGTFAAPVEVAGPGAGLAVKIADLDRDGNPDLVLANASWGTASVTVMRGHGDGTFDAPVDAPPVDGMVFSLALADLDGDGNLDAVAGTASFDNVAVFRGDGRGGFAAPVEYPLAGSGYGVATGDFNGDGRPDVAAVTASGGQVAVFLTGPGGVLGAPTTIGVTGSPWGVAATDFDGDGNVDLVVSASSGGRAVLLRGAGDGSFTQQPALTVGARPWTVVATDLDGDGDVDLATGDANDATASLLTGDGTASFAARVVLPLGFAPPQGPAYGAPSSLIAADADGDRLPDLVAVSSDGPLAVLLNDGEPSATVAPASLDFGAHAVGADGGAQTVTVTNDGSERLVLDDAAFDGAAAGDFTVGADGCSGRTVSVGRQCTVEVRFAAGATGAREATLILGGNDGRGPVTVTVGGSGTQPSCGGDPTPGGGGGGDGDGGPTPGGGGGGTVLPPDPAANVAPTANAVVVRARGNARTARYVFDGRDSVDPDGRVVSWRWQVDGRTVSRAARVTVRLAPRRTPYRVTLTVVDDRGASASRTVTVRAPKAPEIRVTIPAKVGFAFDSAVLSPRARGLLGRLRARVGGAQRLVVVGHADDRGADAYNRALSLRRARAVATVLLDGARPRPRAVAVRGAGSANPIASNRTAAGRAANRRVEIRIVTTKD
jgi:outer membrane protein OmpA-like peptidoglycan-associated protein